MQWIRENKNMQLKQFIKDESYTCRWSIIKLSELIVTELNLVLVRRSCLLTVMLTCSLCNKRVCFGAQQVYKLPYVYRQLKKLVHDCLNVLFYFSSALNHFNKHYCLNDFTLLNIMCFMSKLRHMVDNTHTCYCEYASALSYQRFN